MGKYNLILTLKHNQSLENMVKIDEFRYVYKKRNNHIERNHPLILFHNFLEGHLFYL